MHRTINRSTFLTMTTKLSPSIIKVTVNRFCSKRLKSTASTAPASMNRNTIYTNRPNNTSLILTKQQRHKKSTMIVDGRPLIETKTKTIKSTIEQLSSNQIRSIFLSAAIPMVGFGFMDNFVMITAGQAIDNTLGIRFGLATMVRLRYRVRIIINIVIISIVVVVKITREKRRRKKWFFFFLKTHRYWTSLTFDFIPCILTRRQPLWDK